MKCGARKFERVTQSYYLVLRGLLYRIYNHARAPGATHDDGRGFGPASSYS
jgi:hypothetical protein